MAGKTGRYRGEREKTPASESGRYTTGCEEEEST
jgi:hypothetical protein